MGEIGELGKMGEVGKMGEQGEMYDTIMEHSLTLFPLLL